ncbi:MAG: NUDIX domain-containing protein [Nitrospinota bacterium]
MRVRPSALIVQKEKVLLLRYHYGDADVYAVPGGSPEPMETLEQALIREVDEELSVPIRIQEIFLMGETISDKKEAAVLHTVFLAEIVSGAPQVNPENTSTLGFFWADVASLSSLNMYPNIGERVFEKLSGGKCPAEVYMGQIDQKWFE